MVELPFVRGGVAGRPLVPDAPGFDPCVWPCEARKDWSMDLIATIEQSPFAGMVTPESSSQSHFRKWIP
jgi:hypothetical protein